MVMVYLIFFGGFFVYMFSLDHFLVTLISLEYMSMGMFFIILFVSLVDGFDFFILILYLIMVVSEGVLGLSMLVNMVRFWGMDSFSAVNLLRC